MATRVLSVFKISSSLRILSPCNSSIPSLLLNFILPTAERSYLSGLKKRLLNNVVAASFVGGSPGRIILYISTRASISFVVESALRVSAMYGPDSISFMYRVSISLRFNSSKTGKDSSSINVLASMTISPVDLSRISFAMT